MIILKRRDWGMAFHDKVFFPLSLIGNVKSKSLFEEPTNIVYICLAIGVVLAFLVFLTCMIYKKHLYVF